MLLHLLEMYVTHALQLTTFGSNQDHGIGQKNAKQTMKREENHYISLSLSLSSFVSQLIQEAHNAVA